MRKILLILGLAALTSSPAQAKIVVDEFNDPAAGTHFSLPGAGNQLVITSPPSIADVRTLIGRQPGFGRPEPALEVGGDLFTVVLPSTNTAAVEFDFSPNEDLRSLLLEDVNLQSGSAQVDVAVRTNNSMPWNTVYSRTLTGATLDADGHFRLGVGGQGSNLSGLRLTFTSNSPGILRFDSSRLTSTPEPASMGLLGMAMSGGYLGWRRRRKKKLAEAEEETA